MKSPTIIILFLVIIGGFAYGPLKNAGQKSTAPSNTSSAIGTNTEQSSNTEVSKNIKTAEGEIREIEKTLEEQKEESRRSPYYGKISMSWIARLNSPDPSDEYTTLYNNLQGNETMKITGWYLKSELTGNTIYIGGAALLPFPFTNTESDIIMKTGDRVIIHKGFSPIGISFRTNICTGFFEENRTFNPSLPLYCPRPIDEELPRFSQDLDREDECLDIIERIPHCTTVDSRFLRDLPDTVSESCKTYISTQINYNSCVANHLGDTNFPGSEYHVYLKRFGPLWRSERERINLHDENGLIVASIKY